MSRQDRTKLIGQIEKLRGSRVLVYVTGDRGNLTTNIGDDAVRPIMEHLRRMGDVDKLDVFIYSRGGAIDVPWRLNSAFRRTAKQWDALIPFRANSAATLLSLGANRIVLGRQAELGPIDPTLSIQNQGPAGPVQQSISVEDLMAFPKFATERFGLTGEDAKIAAFNRLADRIDAVTLGNIHRTHSHIRDLAEKMLRSRGEVVAESTISGIIEALAEKVYAHGHAVGYEEASDIGLHVDRAPDELDQLIWDLLGVYETDLKLLEPLDPFALVGSGDRHTEDIIAGVIETTDASHEFRAQIEITPQREMPQNLQVQLNMPVALPPGINPAQLPPAIQQLLQQVPQMMLPSAQTAVSEALKAQARVVGCEVRWLNAQWRLTESTAAPAQRAAPRKAATRTGGSNRR